MVERRSAVFRLLAPKDKKGQWSLNSAPMNAIAVLGVTVSRMGKWMTVPVKNSQGRYIYILHDGTTTANPALSNRHLRANFVGHTKRKDDGNVYISDDNRIVSDRNIGWSGLSDDGWANSNTEIPMTREYLFEVPDLRKKQTAAHGKLILLPSPTNFYTMNPMEMRFRVAWARFTAKNLVYGAISGRSGIVTRPIRSLMRDLTDGNYHPIDGPWIAFKHIARLGFPTIMDTMETLIAKEYSGKTMKEIFGDKRVIRKMK